MADRMTGIEVFVLAMRLGSLSAAARSMGMSAAMAAKHLDSLEGRLGATLVHRTTRRLSLTEAGAGYLDKAERIMVDLREAENEASSRAIAIEGLLRVSAPATFGVMHLAALVAEFGARQPGVTIELGLNDRYVDLLEERWDVAIRIGRLADSSLIARKLAKVRLTICAAPDYLARRGTPRTVEDLGLHNCLGYTLAPLVGGSSWAFGADGGTRVPIRGSLQANNGEALVNAARAGHGIVYAPRFMAATFIAAGELVELDFGMALLDLGAIYAVTHPTRRPAAKTRAWIDFLAERMPALAVGW
ncbi:LysR family transcriptional regulator [Sphingomonas abietis]|uniref:LysR family transcriptional regulator n=1 Tax=Sphingomonas abietis TaxID=3012344 RepID=A0ABY7NQX4_9SPHN|nr:LysR family transcriptional regulator [Sphingomonas abietis]WBO22846.1 LysR family transcriptional regulator [Sphingomonas abietis]